MIYDVIVIGGGPSGMMSAISASKSNRVLLIEKNQTLGKKLLLTGGGRCNVTNNSPTELVINNIIGNGKFLYSAFSHFDNKDIINFFESRNVKLKEEDNGRMFPTTNSSKTILETLINELNKNNVDIKTNSTVIDIEIENNKISKVFLNDGSFYKTKNLIICTGGISLPQTGSTGDGYKFALKAKHTITKLYPTEVPLISDEQFIKDKTLMGLSLKNISLSVLNKKGKIIITHNLDMIFTHFGISGPAVLRCSSFVIKQNEKEVTMILDSIPNMSKNELMEFLKNEKNINSKKSIKNILKNLLPERYVEFICNDISNNQISSLTNNQILEIVDKIKLFKFNVHGSLPIEKSFVTGGGISLKEVDPKTMKSKLIDNLYFAGEVLDINGYTGGYNITAAFVSGNLAGKLL